MNIITTIFNIIISPLVFLICLPIEYPLWGQYKKEGYNVPGYVKFFWYRCIKLRDISYKKIKPL